MSHSLLECSSDIVCAYLSHNRVEPLALCDLVRDVHFAVWACSAGASAEKTPRPTAISRSAALAVRGSISNEALTSFIDGKQYRMLKRHLTTNGFTPETYREKFGLPTDYPMVAGNYSRVRSDIAKEIGLGLKPRTRTMKREF
jgi:predicted transcriptional regulator